MTRPSPQMAAWSTASQLGSGCRLRVGGDQIEARLDGVVLSEGFDETQDGERAELLVLVDGESVGDIEWPAVDDAFEVAFTAEVCEQLAHLLGASGVHHITPVDLGEPTDGLVFDREDAVAAATQFFGEGCADAGVVDEDEPGRINGRVLVLIAGVCIRLIGRDAPLNFEQSLVDTIGRHPRRGAQRLHREAVEDGERSRWIGDRDVALDLSLVAERTRTEPSCVFGCTVDRAVAYPGGR